MSKKTKRTINKRRRTKLKNIGKAAAAIAGMSLLPSITSGAVNFRKASGTQTLYLMDDGRVCIGTTTPADANLNTKLTVSGDIKTSSGGKIYNAVWNDLAEFRPLKPKEKSVPGKAYVLSSTGATLSKKRAQKGCLGICSDSFGFALGGKEDKTTVAIGISGWVLAYVDKEYPLGTALTCGKDGFLTKMRWYEKMLYPERLLGIVDKKPEKYNNLKVNGRCWVKIK
jgi:hypothetical protein